VVVVVFFGVVVVDDVERSEWLPLESGFGVDLSPELSVVVVVVGAAGGGAGLVVDGVPASTRVPPVAPGRGSVLAGGAWVGDGVAPAEGLAGAASTGGDGGGTAVSGVRLGRAASVAALGRERAACRARRTSGRVKGETPAVEKRDDTSWTPNSPRSTPLAVPRAHVTTRTRRTGQMVRSAPP